MTEDRPLDLVFLGLSITSSWGNGHATNYRALLEELDRRGHRCLFLERDVPWYASHRDLPEPSYCDTRLYGGMDDLRDRFAERIRKADAVVVGSYVPDGVEVGRWVTRHAGGVTAFYDIDTPVTLARLRRGDREYLSPELVRCYDLYLSFSSGPVLETLEREYGSPAARPFHCLVDAERYRPDDGAGERWLVGYMGTYSEDRQPPLDALLLEPARRRPENRFVVAGPQYPDDITWPANVERIDHLPPARHADFYNAQRFTLNVTREDMVRAGWSPSVRLFEAAACGVPVVSDVWEGIETFFRPGEEIFLAGGPEEVERILDEVSPGRAREVGRAARRRVLERHTPAARADELERYLGEVRERDARPPAQTAQTAQTARRARSGRVEAGADTAEAAETATAPTAGEAR